MCKWGQGKSQIILNLLNIAIPGKITLLESLVTASYPSLPPNCQLFHPECLLSCSSLYSWLKLISGHCTQYKEHGLYNNSLCNLGQIISISIDFPIWKMKIICLSLRLNGLTYVHVLKKSMSHIWFDEY